MACKWPRVHFLLVVVSALVIVATARGQQHKTPSTSKMHVPSGVLHANKTATAKVTRDNVAPARQALDAFVENVVLIGGPSPTGSGTSVVGTATLVDCKPPTSQTATAGTLQCLVATADHTYARIKGRRATVYLRRASINDFQTLTIRELTLARTFASMDATPVNGDGRFELVVGSARFSIDLPPAKNTLVGLRDVLNALASSSSNVFASISPRRSDQPRPVYALNLHPHGTVDQPEISVELWANGKNLLIERPLWITHPRAKNRPDAASFPIKDIDVGMMQIEVPAAFIKYRLTLADFADVYTLQKFRAGDDVWCIGYTNGRPSTPKGTFAGVRKGSIYAYPFPPSPQQSATFLIDAKISEGQSGGPCVAKRDDGRLVIIGTVSANSQEPEMVEWSRGVTTHLIDTNLAEIVQGPLVKELATLFYQKNE